MGDIITNLDPTTVISSTSVWLGALFNELFPVALIGLGIILAGAFIAFVIRTIINATTLIFSKDDRTYWLKTGIKPTDWKKYHDQD